MHTRSLARSLARTHARARARTRAFAARGPIFTSTEIRNRTGGAVSEGKAQGMLLQTQVHEGTGET
eukprot:3380142-Alexandrium_andersonii.AAC.1